MFICVIDLSNTPLFASSRSWEILSETVKPADSDSMKTTCLDDVDKGNKIKVVDVARDDSLTLFSPDIVCKDLERRVTSVEQRQPSQGPVKSPSSWPNIQHKMCKPQGSGIGGFK
jgi:hypothetical protein